MAPRSSHIPSPSQAEAAPPQPPPEPPPVVSVLIPPHHNPPRSYLSVLIDNQAYLSSPTTTDVVISLSTPFKKNCTLHTPNSQISIEIMPLTRLPPSLMRHFLDWGVFTTNPFFIPQTLVVEDVGHGGYPWLENFRRPLSVDKVHDGLSVLWNLYGEWEILPMSKILNIGYWNHIG